MEHLRFYYGTKEDCYIDVTTITYKKCIEDNNIKLPCTDHERADIYDDPMFGHIKHMLVVFEDIRCVVRPFSRQLVINCENSDTIRESLRDYLYWDNVIPIYIISFNNYTYVKNTVDQLSKFTKNIIIVDNCSSYQILLEYYKICGITVIRNKINYNVQTELYCIMEPYMPEYYVITDPDLQFSDKMSLEVLDKLKELIDKYRVYKAGLALEIEQQDFKNLSYYGYSIYEWEKQFWSNILEPGVYKANVDTTFTMCCSKNYKGSRFDGIRLANGYECKHLPWYKNPSIAVPEQELIYYRSTQKYSSWNR